jgi:hypothetical protein
MLIEQGMNAVFEKAGIEVGHLADRNSGKNESQ